MDIALLVIERLTGGKSELGIEEHLDGIIFIVSDYIRKYDVTNRNEDDDSQRILYYIMNPEQVYSQNHFTILSLLNKLIMTSLSDTEIGMAV